jgi:hypothetical protein
VPFSNLAGDGPARVVLEQVDDTQFRILEPFKYISPSGNEYVVPASDPDNPDDVTDLASVPWMLRWLVASYGQHTLAALLHDQLVAPGMTRDTRVKADTVFFRALEESGNNWMRHRLMWVAVAVGGTMWNFARAACVVFFAHVVAFWIAVLWWIGFLAWLGRQPWFFHIPYVDHHGRWAGLAAAALLVLGFAWRATRAADPALSWWLWVVAAFAVALVVPPCALIAGSVRVVQWVDHVVAAVKGAGPAPYRRPSPLQPPEIAKTAAREAASIAAAQDPAAG